MIAWLENRKSIYLLVGFIFCLCVNNSKAESITMKHELISFKNEKAEITLHGCLTMPDNVSKNIPLFIVVHGYGRMDRDATQKERKPFLKIAKYLAEHGIATFRYDKRGVGESEGVYESATVYEFIEDAEAAFLCLQESDYNFSKIGFIGLSEGGLVATGVAARQPTVDGIILLAPAFLGADQEYVLGALEKQFRVDGASDHFIRAEREMRKKFFQIIRSETDIQQAEKMLRVMLQDYVMQQKPEEKIEAQRLTFAVTEGNLERMVQTFNSPWTRAFFSINPLDFLKKVQCPLFLVTGELDFIAPTEYLVSVVQEGISHKEQLSHVDLHKHTHAFVEGKTGAFKEYFSLQEDISQQTLDSMVKWIKKHF